MIEIFLKKNNREIKFEENTEEKDKVLTHIAEFTNCHVIYLSLMNTLKTAVQEMNDV